MNKTLGPTIRMRYGRSTRRQLKIGFVPDEDYTGLSLRGGGRGFSPATTNVAPGCFQRKMEKKIERKEIPRCLILRLLFVFAWQLEILVTTLIMGT